MRNNFFPQEIIERINAVNRVLRDDHRDVQANEVNAIFQMCEEAFAAETAKADQKIEAARGIATALVVEAEGQAEANRLLNASLTPILIQFAAVQKLADDLQIALIPAGEGVIIDPANLLSGTVESAPLPTPAE